MKKKVTIFLYIFILLAVIAMFCGTAYAYYKKVIVKDEANVTVKTINLLVEYDNGSKINLEDLKYDQEYTHSFIIRNDSDDEIGKYKIQLEIITPFTKAVDENFIYNLECDTPSSDNVNKLVSITDGVVPVSNKEIGEGTITPNNSHACKIVFKIKSDNQDKEYLKNKIFVAKVKILSSNE